MRREEFSCGWFGSVLTYLAALQKKKVLVKESYRCIYLRGMHVVCYLWLYTGNYLSRELGSAPGTPERKMQPQCLQQSSQSLQEEWAQQENPPTTSSTWICLWLDFGRMSLSWDWLNFNSVSECCDCKQLHWLQQYPASLWVVALQKANCQKGWQREGRLTSPAPAHWDLSLPCSGNNLHRNGPTAGTSQSPEHLSHFRHSALAIAQPTFISFVSHFCFRTLTPFTLIFSLSSTFWEEISQSRTQFSNYKYHMDYYSVKLIFSVFYPCPNSS